MSVTITQTTAATTLPALTPTEDSHALATAVTMVMA